ncbi:ArsR/SmtB family transcription factor [Natranaeroarchaeum aerophilus]|uniref:Winged helix-turn-helix domain-containing protein n=1 Tax=Natranaeroarchaeum aerophilus TaxID=2917711 RepID=A0AAE3FR28_9EURY|nr:winged helix-turn-helix domain-containing protein [Natranaeroarchaeum aerophilus]MCL9813591.1 winged helix-turn-helix domain-containing protein [Natranaeroarchaeum aerophilus]
MADLLPSFPDTSTADDGAPRVVGIDSDEADDVLAALSANTARQLLTALHDDPGTPSELANRVDTSLQNAQYHLGKLEDANVVRVIDTAYSEKGREMNVYGPTDQPLVVFAGDESKETGLRAALKRLVGGIGALAAGSLFVQALAGEGILGGADDGAPATAEDDEEEPTDGDAGAPEEEEEEFDIATDDEEDAPPGDDAPADDVEEDDDAEPTTAEDDGFDIPFVEDDFGLIGISGLPPGALFFAGGATVMAAWFLLWYVRINR